MVQEPEARKRKRVRWRGTGTALLAVFVGLAALDLAIRHVMVWRMAREVVSDPRFAVMPQPLPGVTIADLRGGVDMTALGYSFRVPWSVAKEDGRKIVSIVKFSNGASLNIFDFKSDPMGPGLLKKATLEEAAAYRAMYGELAMTSKYEFLKAELNTSPSEISFWQSSARNVAVMTKLLGKGGVVLPASKNLYSIAEGNLRGFQVGDASQAKSAVMLVLFGPQDDEVRVTCYSTTGDQWTQPEINAVIASIRSAQ